MTRSHISMIIPAKDYLLLKITNNAISSDSFVQAKGYRRIGTNT